MVPCPIDDHEAVNRCFALAAASGDSDGHDHLGESFFFGWGVDEDVEPAIIHYATAAIGESSHARSFLADLCLQGSLSEEEEVVAVLSRAAVNGCNIARLELGKMYKRGIGVELDEEGAIRLFRLRAAEDDSGALIELAICYRDGSGWR